MATPVPPLDLDAHVVPARYLTEDVPPLGGRIKERPEDFIVEELPRYEPSGEGEHLYLFVQKRNLPTLAAVRALAAHFGVSEQAVGYAGLKDKRAVTRQLFSIHAPGKRIEDFPSLRHERLEVLWADRHTNKLRPGHLAGNRFVIRIRGVEATRAVVAKRVLGRLERVGVPNRFGEQRFGLVENNHLVGRALVLGDDAAALDVLLGPGGGPPDARTAEGRARYAAGDPAGALAAFPRSLRAERAALRVLARGGTPAQAVEVIGRAELTFYLSAFQSAVFNAVLDARLLEGTLGVLRPGDLASKHENLAVFRVDEATLAQPDTAERLEALLISPSGPMWGASMMRAEGATGRAELAALLATGVEPEDLEAYERRRQGLINGSRRPLRVPLMYPDVEGGIDEHGHYIRCSFELPRGAFATAVLREIMKPERAGGPAPEAPDDEESDEQ